MPHARSPLGQQRRPLAPGRSAHDLWGAELRAWRDQRGLSLARLAGLVRYDASYLARLERAERFPPEEVARACDRELRTGGELLRLWQMADAERQHTGVHVASSALHVASPASEVEPDTPVAAASDTEELILPCRTADGKVIWVSVPRRTFLVDGLGLAAGTAIGIPSRQAQGLRPRVKPDAVADAVQPIDHLRHLRAVLVESDNLLGPRSVIQAVGDHLRVIGQLRADSRRADRRALLQVQAEYAEFAGWLHQDIGDFAGARSWLDRALELAHAGGDAEFPAFVLARKSQLAGDMHDPVTALDLAEAAVMASEPHPKLAGAALTYAAHGHALDGMHKESMQALDRAGDYAVSSVDSPTSLAAWLDASYIEVQRARCLSVLGQHGAAAAIFEQAIEDLGPQYRRDRGVYLARAGQAHAGNEEPERAAAAGLQALTIAHQTGSGRIITELATLNTDLAHWKALPAVRAFHDTLTEALPRQVPAPPR